MIASLGERRPQIDGAGQFIAPGACIIGSVRLHANASIWFNAVLRGDNDWIEVGANSNVQDGAVLHTDAGMPLTVGEGVTIGHRAMLHGCEIGDNTLIGIGSTVLNGARVGANCLVGAHALITEGKSFPDGVLILGAPARVVRRLNREEIDDLRRSARIYVENGRRYSEQLAEVPA